MTNKKKAAAGFGTRAASNTTCGRHSNILQRIASGAAALIWPVSPAFSAWLAVHGGSRHG